MEPYGVSWRDALAVEVGVEPTSHFKQQLISFEGQALQPETMLYRRAVYQN